MVPCIPGSIVGPLLPLLLAQAPPFVAGMKRTIALPSTPASITRTVAGDVSGDRRSDTVMLADGQVWFSFSSDVYQVIEAVSSDECGIVAKDIDLLPVTGGIFEILVVSSDLDGSNGALRRVRFDKSPPTSPKAFHGQVIPANTEWASSTGVRLAAINGGARDDLLGVNGTDILLLLDVNGTKATSSFHAANPALGAVLEAIAIPRGPGVADAIGVRRPTAVQIYESFGPNKGQLLKEWSSDPLVVDDLQPVSCYTVNGALETRVAMVTGTGTTGARYLRVGRINGSTTDDVAM